MTGPPTPPVARPATIADMRALCGVRLGPGPWHEIAAPRVAAFARATGDRAGLDARGLLILSLGPVLTAELLSYEHFDQVLNYGYDAVRLSSSTATADRVRMTLTVEEVTDAPRGGARVAMRLAFDLEGADAPVCEATAIVQLSDR